MRALIGLELHARLRTTTKAFSPAIVSFARQPNSAATAFDAAHPGTYPVMNRGAVDAAIRTGLALNMTVADRLQFDRKHYFYYDLPAGYQITQERLPICHSGHLDVEPPQALHSSHDSSAPSTSQSHRSGEQGATRVNITRLQLEHDSAKSVHTAAELTLVDLNRAGIGLMEIVTAPDMSTSAQAVAFVRELLDILKALDVCDGSLSEGSLRVDANVNVVDDERGVRSPRCEVKNINGLRFLAKAIDFEISRQKAAIKEGTTLRQETRYFDPRSSETVHMRIKEENLDYRYMPEPDLPPMAIPRSWVEECRLRLPTLPSERIAHTAEHYNISRDYASLLVRTTGALGLFEACLQSLGDNAFAPQVASFITTDVFAHAKQRNQDIDSLISADVLADIVRLVNGEVVSLRAAKEIMALKLQGDTRSADELVDALDLRQESDDTLLEQLATDVVRSHEKQRNKYLKGQHGVLGFFVGQIMGKTKGKANPHKVRAAVEAELAKHR